MKFPKTVAAVKVYLDAEQKTERSQWNIGDALLKECGSSSEQGVRDGSYERLEEAYEEIQIECKTDKFGVRYLARLRDVSEDFSTTERLNGVAWRTHEEAGNPEILHKLQKAYGRKPLTFEFAHETVSKWRQQQKKRDEKKYPKPQGKPEKKKAGGGGLDQAARSIKAAVLAGEATEAGEKYLEIYQAVIKVLEDDYVDAAVTECVEVIDAWQKALNLLKSRQAKRGSHLRVVS